MENPFWPEELSPVKAEFLVRWVCQIEAKPRHSNFNSKRFAAVEKMFNYAFFVIILLMGFVNTMSIKRSDKSENNLEKVDETEYPLKVNYDVYPVRIKSCWFEVARRLTKFAFIERSACGRSFVLCNRSKFCVVSSLRENHSQWSRVSRKMSKSDTVGTLIKS